MSKKRQGLLGMPWGAAAHRLRKAIMFNLARRLDLCRCVQCGHDIDNVDDFTIEHKKPWQAAADPAAAFFDLDNIGFSHHSCNSRAARRGFNKRYADPDARRREWNRENQAARNASRKAWRQRRREAGLPYT